MRFFVLLFLVGIACAKPVYDVEDETDIWDDFDLSSIDRYLAFAVDETTDDDVKTNLGKKLKDIMSHLIDTVNEAIKDGKEIKEKYIVKINELKEKLKDLHEELGETLKERLEVLKQKVKAHWKKLWDKLTGGNDEAKRNSDDDLKTELGKKLKENLEKVIGKIKDAIDHGKEIKEEYIEKIKELKEELKELGIGIGEKIKEKLEGIKEKVKDRWNKILEELGLKGEPKRSEDTEETPNKLREALDKLLEQVKDTITQGKEVKEEVLNKVKEIREKLKKLREDIGERAKEILQQIKDKTKEFFEKIRKLFELDGKKERSPHEDDVELVTRHLPRVIRFLEELRETIETRFDVKKIKDKVDSFCGFFPVPSVSEICQQISDRLKEKAETAKSKLLELIDNTIGKKDNRDERSLKELWEKIKNYFKNLNIELKEKFLKLGDYVKEHMGKALEKAKDVHERVKIIAKELLDHAKDLHQDIKKEAEEFLLPYKEDLGKLYEQLKEAFKITNKEDE